MRILKKHVLLRLVNSYLVDSPEPALRIGFTLLWVKLSNTGNTLKLKIPNYIRKVISGWTNYSCMVTSQKIIEREIGNRGSKSGFLLKSVKEQRVDGSWLRNNLNKLANPIRIRSLRFTLMGLVTGYQIKNPSKQLQLNYKIFLLYSLKLILDFELV
jgi:hypothetical protein